ncbi:MAG: 1-acyl-sn-glycerol-3-phosphate acyltransferase [Phycisphaerae bacterium]|nr:1-acyl-sn-glycerol-3-phosphate acyltransferase [Phycisphaerae bacterium]
MRIMFSALFKSQAYNRHNVPLEGPVLLVSNHQSFLDPMLCGAGINREAYYMARDTLFKNPVFGAMLRSVNSFPVQRDKADVKAIKDIINRLKSGKVVTMFPEGTRTTDGKIQPFKSGFDVIARRSKATTVPVVIDGAYEAWPRHQLFPAMGTIRVMYGQPITPQECKTLSREEFVARINQQLCQMQNELRTRYGRPPLDYAKSPIIEKIDGQ